MDNSMHERFGDFIRSQLPHLASTTKVDESFLDYLLFLSVPGRDKILAEKVKYSRSSIFYTEEVITRGPSTLPHIIHALRKTKQDPLADYILENGGSAFLETPSSHTTNSPNPNSRKLLSKQKSDSSSGQPTNPVQQSQPRKLKRFGETCDSFDEDLIPTKYCIESSPRGFALIINMIEFENVAKLYREGAKHDSEQLGNLLKSFGYDVYDENLTEMDFFETIKMFLQMFADKSVDSCIVSIMTHGEHGDLILTSDRKKITVKQVLEKFNNVNCPQLKGKPKIFFMQHCRGDQLDRGISADYDGVSTDGPEDREITVPTWTDMLVCYSTIEGYYSFREKEKGTLFIQILCEVFRKHSKKHDICKMLNLVAKKMMDKSVDLKKKDGTIERGVKQICPYYNMGFISEFYFQSQG